MPGTLAASWSAASQRGERPVISATFSGATDSTVTSNDFLLGISAVTAKANPLSRSATASGCSVTVSDEWARALLLSGYLRAGLGVVIKVGFPSIAAGDYYTFFTGVVDSFVPKGPTTVVIQCGDWYSAVRRRFVRGSWLTLHPLEIAKQVLLSAGISSSKFDSTFDPTLYANSHLNASIYSGGAAPDVIAWTGNTNMGSLGTVGGYYAKYDSCAVGDALDTVCRMLNGAIYIGPDGRFTFREFDGTTVDVALTEDDYNELSFNQIEVGANIINRVVIKGDTQGKTENIGSQAFYCSVNETASQTNYAHPDETVRVYEEALSLGAEAGFAFIEDDMTAVATTAYISGGTLWRMTGMIVPDPWLSSTTTWTANAQDSNRTCTVARPGYYLIDNEIIKITGVSLDVNDTTFEIVYGDVSDLGTATYDHTRHLPNRATITMVRGALGTTAAAHSSWVQVGADVDEAGSPIMEGGAAPMIDITAAVLMAQALLARTSYGMDAIEIDLPLERINLNLFDIVSVTNDGYMSQGVDGLTSSTTWEVVSRDLKTGEGGGVHVELASAGVVSTTTSAAGSAPRFGLALSNAVSSGQAMAKVDSGLVVSAATGLTVDIAAGQASTDKAGVAIGAATAVAMPQSKDVYLFTSPTTGAIRTAVRTTGAAAPVARPGETPLTKIVMGAAAVTSTTEIKRTKALSGVSIAASTVGARATTSKMEFTGNLFPDGDFNDTSDG